MTGPAVNALAAGVVLDMTTIIGAEDYIASYNERRRPLDPFARQCFVELTQSAILQPSIHVIHPTLPNARPDDFGLRPHLARCLFAAGVAQPLGTSRSPAGEAADVRSLGRRLQDEGVRPLLAFIDKTTEIDGLGGVRPMADRFCSWADYQKGAVHSDPTNHAARIPTRDGIENDVVGDWVRSASHTVKGELSKLAGIGNETRVLSMLVRGLRYHSRTQEAGVLYQAHPMRRDFLLYFNVRYSLSETDIAGRLLEEVRGVHEKLRTAGGSRLMSRFEVAEMVTPLLGGRLWKDNEVGRHGHDGWIELVVGRLVEYRIKAGHLRAAVAACSTEEDWLRLRSDVSEVTHDLMRDLGIRPHQRTAVEQDLISAASVVDGGVGVPMVTAATLLLRGSMRRMLTSRKPYAQFLYKELKYGYTAAGG